jgi:hypothetical protein
MAALPENDVVKENVDDDENSKSASTKSSWCQILKKTFILLQLRRGKLRSEAFSPAVVSLA